ncbi:MAG: hypothetical protein WCT99_00355 [Bacteroidota bacterium]|jgi:hypothetical protein
MKKLSDLIGNDITIIQPSVFKRIHEFWMNGERYATMKFPRLFSSQANVQLSDQQWEFYRPSIWRSDVEVRQQGYQLPIAKYAGRKWKQGGTIELPRGDRLIHQEKIWTNANMIAAESGTPLVSFQRKGFFGTAVLVTLHEKSDILDKYPWVIMLVWYVLLQQRRDAATH